MISIPVRIISVLQYPKTPPRSTNSIEKLATDRENRIGYFWATSDWPLGYFYCTNLATPDVCLLQVPLSRGGHKCTSPRGTFAEVSGG